MISETELHGLPGILPINKIETRNLQGMKHARLQIANLNRAHTCRPSWTIEHDELTNVNEFLSAWDRRGLGEGLQLRREKRDGTNHAEDLKCPNCLAPCAKRIVHVAKSEGS